MTTTISRVRRALRLGGVRRKLNRIFLSCTSHPSDSVPEPSGSKSLGGAAKPATGPASSYRALIIGIDKYKHAGSDTFDHLCGCVADADDMYQYLTKTRSVSPAGIIILRNEDATRERILENIQAIQNADIPRDTPILIFWAGYGSRARAAPNSTQHVQILLPHDFDPKAKNRKDQGIPDYMFDRLLSEVARLKGDNVTVILDACHVGSSALWTTESRVRGFDLPSDYVLNDPAVEGASRVMIPSTTPSHSATDTTSYVLLAAASSSRPAREEKGRGVFTRALLNFLREHSRPGLLTYSDIILGLPPLDPAGVQLPQCEGRNAGRHLFRTAEPTSGYRFRIQDDQITVEARETCNISKAALFDLYAHLDLNQPPALRGLTSERIDAGHMMLRLPPDSMLNITEGWALQTFDSTDTSVVVDIVYDKWSPTTISQALSDFDRNYPGRVRVALVCDDRQQLFITKEVKGKLVFDLKDEICRSVGLKRLHHSTKVEPIRLQEILAPASEFFYHLGYSNQQHLLHGQLKIEAYLLDDISNTPKPVGEDLLVGSKTMSPNHVYGLGDPGPHQCYGFSIKNGNSEPLYVWIFAFNMNDLSIDEVYRPVPAKEKTRACIEPHGVLTIGYGNGGVVPQAFFVPDGESTAVTYLKIFVSTSRLELGHIPQVSPFLSGHIGMNVSRREMTPDSVWDTLVVTMIQQTRS